MAPKRRYALVSISLVIVACGGAGADIDAGGLDAAHDAPKLGMMGDASQDAPQDVVIADAVDEQPGPEASVDAGADVVEAGPEAAPGGDICPGVGLCNGACSCDAGYTNQFRVTDPDSGIDYLCGTSGAPMNPSCPKGWKCWNLGYLATTCP